MNYLIELINYMNYKNKYLKYKSKYLKHKTQFGGNRFTLIINCIPPFDMYYYFYKYFIVDNLKPTNIYTFDSSIPWIPCDNIVAYYHGQTDLQTSDGGYDELSWPKRITDPIFRGTQDYENNNYRLEI